MPRDTLTSSPRPGWPRAGATDAGPCSRTGSTAPPWAPTPGTRNASPGRERPDPRELVGRRGTDDEADRAAGSPAGGQPGDALVEPLRGAVGGRVGGDFEVLELARPGVGGPAQHVGEPVGALEQR